MTRGAVVVLLAAGLFLGNCRGCGAQEAKKPIEADVALMVNGDPVRIDEVEMAILSIPPEEIENYIGADGLQRILHELAVRRLMIQWAEQKGLGDNPVVKRRIEHERDRILLQALLERAVSDQDINQYFQEHFIRAYFLLVLFPEDADQPEKQAARRKAHELYERLQAGADFVELSEQATAEDDNIVAQQFTVPIDYDAVAEEAGLMATEALFALKEPGAISRPVEGRRGYFIFQLLEPAGMLSPEWLTSEWRREIREIKEREVYRSYANTLLTRPDTEIIDGPALPRLMEDYARAWREAQEQTAADQGDEPSETDREQTPPDQPGLSLP